MLHFIRNDAPKRFYTFAFFLISVFVTAKFLKQPYKKSAAHLLIVFFCADVFLTNAAEKEFTYNKNSALAVDKMFTESSNTNVRSFVNNFLQENKQPFGRVATHGTVFPYHSNWPSLFKTQVTGDINFIPLKIKRFSNLLNLADYSSPLFNLLSTPLIVGKKNTLKNHCTQQGKSLPNNFKLLYDQEYQIYQNITALPRAFIAPYAFECLNDTNCLEIMTDPSFNPSQHAVISPDHNKINPATNLLQWAMHTASNATHPNPSAQVEINSYRENEISININSNTNGYLIITDNYFPGWQAFVNGTLQPVYRADYTFRGVFVMKGKSDVIMRFKPFSFQTLKESF